MGQQYVSKLIMLDENDFRLGEEIESCEELIEMAYEAFQYDSSQGYLKEDEIIEPVGFLSERLDSFTEMDGYKGPYFLHNAGWNSCISKIFKSDLGITPHETASFLKTDNPHDIALRLTNDLECGLSYREKSHKKHEWALKGISHFGMPGFLNSDAFLQCHRDDFCDFRSKNFGPGRRVLMEVAFMYQ
jgi:hypothetical protein